MNMKKLFLFAALTFLGKEIMKTAFIKF